MNSNFILNLRKELLSEVTASGPPEKIQMLLTKLVYKEPFAARLFGRSHTDYYADPSIITAGVCVHQGRIEFYYNPPFIQKLSEAELNFLLQHELYHIFRSHGKRGEGAGATTDRLHYLMNIAQDALINADCKKFGGFGGHSMKVIDGAWFLSDSYGSSYGSINATWGKDGVVQQSIDTKTNEIISSSKDGKDKFTGDAVSETIYKWMMERDKDAQKKSPQLKQLGKKEKKAAEEEQKKKQSSKPGPPWEPSIGDVVYNEKTKQYGKVVSRHGKNMRIEPITEKEAEVAVKEFKQKLIKTPQKLIKTPQKFTDLWA